MRQLLLLGLIALTTPAWATVRLPYLFTHHMVLQRDAPVPVWGWASPGEGVTVLFDGQEKHATADSEGRWRVDLEPLSVGEPRELVARGDESGSEVVVRDVLVGDVWICSGQSNMEWWLDTTKDADLAQMAADRPQIRLMRVKQLGTQEPLDDVDSPWYVCSRESAGRFSAVGYYFGVQLQESLDVPIGLIQNAWGGSSCEAWAPLERLEQEPLVAPELEVWRKKEAESDEAKLRAEYAEKMEAFYRERDAAYASGAKPPRPPWVDNSLFHQHRPANLWNARIKPLIPFAIKGVVWYQGETNAGRAYAYRELFPLTIQAWRDAWGQGDFPFYWVQLADWQAEVDGAVQHSWWPELREAQTMTLDRLPNVGEAVVIDIGEANDIHPRNKRDVGLRLARLALAKTYDKPIKGESARYASLETTGGKAVVTFEGVGEGLKTFDGVAPVGFGVAGEDRVFHDAVAEIVGPNRVELSSPEVAEPIAVRYGWADNPRVNLFDSAWLPVTPFRTDDWPGVTQPKGD